MNWIDNYDLFLFDFDGLLVDTERLHYKAYQEMCRRYGFELPWSFLEFCSVAHGSSEGLRVEIYKLFPELFEKEPDWAVLYEIKQASYLRFLKEGELSLMPGAAALLTQLQKANKKRIVVTNSRREQIEEIKKQCPELDLIQNWVTREDYENPKPHPDGYLKAIELFGTPGDQVIGFEDSLRGLHSLISAKVQPVLICHKEHPHLESADLTQVHYFPQLDHISL